MQRSTKQDNRIDLRQTADVIQRPMDDKDEIVGEALSCNEVLCISHNGTMTDDHTL